MPLKDIRIIKKQLREEFKSLRTGMQPSLKAQCDKKIAERIISFRHYVTAKTVFIYLSTEIEVDTRRIIEHAWKKGKAVAVPRCIPETLGLTFHRINSFDSLEIGTFGVWEPIEGTETVGDFSKGLCIVPGLGFDLSGYRLGYGKGYYDRFLTRFGGQTVGLCYSNCVRPRLPHGKFDQTVHYLVTERYLRRLEPQQS